MCFIRPYVGGSLIHQIEVEKLEAFHSGSTSVIAKQWNE